MSVLHSSHTAMLLAAISVAAISNTRESAAKNLLPITHPCHTAAYGDVVRAVEREMELREKLESLTPSSNAPVEQSETRIRHALADLLGFAAEVMEDDDSEDCAIVRNPDGDHDLCGLPLCKATGCAYLKMKNAADALEAVPARRTITPSATEERDDQCRQAYHRDASQAEIGLTTPRPTSPDWTQYAPLKAGKALDVRDLAYAWAKGCNDQAEEIFKVRGGTATVPPSAKASFSRIDLGLFVNAAGISGADVPHIVVEKLQKALDAANVLAVASTRREAEVRLNDNGTLDEVVTKDGDQLEQMDFNHWFLQIGDVAVWLWAKGKITATYERRPSSTCEENQ